MNRRNNTLLHITLSLQNLIGNLPWENYSKYTESTMDLENPTTSFSMETLSKSVWIENLSLEKK